ncbi:MAG: ornithine cyclodeaminase [Alphaproteobacteria bacterium]|jgi:ornithine cyclodeaminase|nr:ornithine cyclodeaminase [Alphaproteobacteria bacterium]
MRQFDAEAIERLLDDAGLIDAIATLFRDGCEVPLRHHHTIETGGAPATLLLMPAWRNQRHLGIKIVTVFPDNGARNLPAVIGQYLLLSAQTGEPLALMDGTALTRRRTAAASALASRFLSRTDSFRLLMIGTGALAPHLIRAHATVRPIREVAIWGRTPAKAAALAERFNNGDLEHLKIAAHVADDIARTIDAADIISCATLAQTPLVQGVWLKKGQHLDLVGGFTPAMREADDEAVRRSRIFVDTRQGAGKEAGDIVQPLANGILKPEGIVADLFELCRGERHGRQGAGEITMFKSVGTALEDLAAAELVVQQA